jgi:uncharacterized protein (DUF924 family)
MRERFGPDQRRAAAGEYESWIVEPNSCLALVLLLDQLPRNLYRGSPRAFACDADARRVADRALRENHDQAVVPVRRQFFYLPFEHSEALADQERSVALAKALPKLPFKANSVDYAERHRAIIARFGCFPHRNQVLGRDSTPGGGAFPEAAGLVVLGSVRLRLDGSGLRGDAEIARPAIAVEIGRQQQFERGRRDAQFR